MSDPTAGESAAAARDEPAPPVGDRAQVDVEKLADRVYRLMLADARLGRARGESIGKRKGR